MKIISIDDDSVTLELDVWQVTWLAQACEAAATVAFGGQVEKVAGADGSTGSARTAHYYEALHVAFEALATAAALENNHLAKSNKHAHGSALAWVRQCTTDAGL